MSLKPLAVLSAPEAKAFATLSVWLSILAALSDLSPKASTAVEVTLTTSARSSPEALAAFIIEFIAPKACVPL